MRSITKLFLIIFAVIFFLFGCSSNKNIKIEDKFKEIASKNNFKQYVIDAGSVVEKQGTIFLLQLNDNFFNKSLSAQYNDLSNIFNELNRDNFYVSSYFHSLVIKNKENKYIYELSEFMKPEEQKYYGNYRASLYIHSVDKLFDRLSFQSTELDSLKKDEVVAGVKADYYILLQKKDLDENIAKTQQIREKKASDEQQRNAQLKNQKPQIGMSEDEVLNSSWGKPTDVNKTTTKYGVTEQWVYSLTRYIYFENGKVTVIQE